MYPLNTLNIEGSRALVSRKRSIPICREGLKRFGNTRAALLRASSPRSNRAHRQKAWRGRWVAEGVAA
jgi:hypothetical protein